MGKARRSFMLRLLYKIAGCVFHGQDTVQGRWHQLLPVNNRLLAVSFCRQDTVTFPMAGFSPAERTGQTVCSLSSDAGSRRSRHHHCGADRIISIAVGIFRNGAADGTRTRSIHLGRVALYQLNYCRINKMPRFDGNRTHICPENRCPHQYRPSNRKYAAGILKRSGKESNLHQTVNSRSFCR